jgi:hypothetical protein
MSPLLRGCSNYYGRSASVTKVFSRTFPRLEGLAIEITFPVLSTHHDDHLVLH